MIPYFNSQIRHRARAVLNFFGYFERVDKIELII